MLNSLIRSGGSVFLLFVFPIFLFSCNSEKEVKKSDDAQLTSLSLMFPSGYVKGVINGFEIIFNVDYQGISPKLATISSIEVSKFAKPSVAKGEAISFDSGLGSLTITAENGATKSKYNLKIKNSSAALKAITLDVEGLTFRGISSGLASADQFVISSFNKISIPFPDNKEFFFLKITGLESPLGSVVDREVNEKVYFSGEDPTRFVVNITSQSGDSKNSYVFDLVNTRASIKSIVLENKYTGKAYMGVRGTEVLDGVKGSFSFELDTSAKYIISSIELLEGNKLSNGIVVGSDLLDSNIINVISEDESNTRSYDIFLIDPSTKIKELVIKYNSKLYKGEILGKDIIFKLPFTVNNPSVEINTIVLSIGAKSNIVKGGNLIFSTLGTVTKSNINVNNRGISSTYKVNLENDLALISSLSVNYKGSVIQGSISDKVITLEMPYISTDINQEGEFKVVLNSVNHSIGSITDIKEGGDLVLFKESVENGHDVRTTGFLVVTSKSGRVKEKYKIKVINTGSAVESIVFKVKANPLATESNNLKVVPNGAEILINAPDQNYVYTIKDVNLSPRSTNTLPASVYQNALTFNQGLSNTNIVVNSEKGDSSTRTTYNIKKIVETDALKSVQITLSTAADATIYDGVAKGLTYYVAIPFTNTGSLPSNIYLKTLNVGSGLATNPVASATNSVNFHSTNHNKLVAITKGQQLVATYNIVVLNTKSELSKLTVSVSGNEYIANIDDSNHLISLVYPFGLKTNGEGNEIPSFSPKLKIVSGNSNTIYSYGAKLFPSTEIFISKENTGKLTVISDSANRLGTERNRQDYFVKAKNLDAKVYSASVLIGGNNYKASITQPSGSNNGILSFEFPFDTDPLKIVLNASYSRGSTNNLIDNNVNLTRSSTSAPLKGLVTVTPEGGAGLSNANNKSYDIIVKNSKAFLKTVFFNLSGGKYLSSYIDQDKKEVIVSAEFSGSPSSLVLTSITASLRAVVYTVVNNSETVISSGGTLSLNSLGQATLRVKSESGKYIDYTLRLLNKKVEILSLEAAIGGQVYTADVTTKQRTISFKAFYTGTPVFTLTNINLSYGDRPVGQTLTPGTPFLIKSDLGTDVSFTVEAIMLPELIRSIKVSKTLSGPEISCIIHPNTKKIYIPISYGDLNAAPNKFYYKSSELEPTTAILKINSVIASTHQEYTLTSNITNILFDSANDINYSISYANTDSKLLTLTINNENIDYNVTLDESRKIGKVKLPYEMLPSSVILKSSTASSGASYGESKTLSIFSKAKVTDGSFKVIVNPEVLSYNSGFEPSIYTISIEQKPELKAISILFRDGNRYSGLIDHTNYTVKFNLPYGSLVSKPLYLTVADISASGNASVTSGQTLDVKLGTISVTSESGDLEVYNFSLVNTSTDINALSFEYNGDVFHLPDGVKSSKTGTAGDPYNGKSFIQYDFSLSSLGLPTSSTVVGLNNTNINLSFGASFAATGLTNANTLTSITKKNTAAIYDFKVTAEDGSTVEYYRLNFKLPADNMLLNNINATHIDGSSLSSSIQATRTASSRSSDGSYTAASYSLSLNRVNYPSTVTFAARDTSSDIVSGATIDAVAIDPSNGKGAIVLRASSKEVLATYELQITLTGPKVRDLEIASAIGLANSSVKSNYLSRFRDITYEISSGVVHFKVKFIGTIAQFKSTSGISGITLVVPSSGKRLGVSTNTVTLTESGSLVQLTKAASLEGIPITTFLGTLNDNTTYKFLVIIESEFNINNSANAVVIGYAASLSGNTIYLDCISASSLSDLPSSVTFEESASVSGSRSDELNGRTINIIKNTGSGSFTLSTGTSYTVQLRIPHTKINALREVIRGSNTEVRYGTPTINGSTITVPFAIGGTVTDVGGRLDIIKGSDAIPGTEISSSSSGTFGKTASSIPISNGSSKIYVKHPSIYIASDFNKTLDAAIPYVVNFDKSNEITISQTLDDVIGGYTAVTSGTTITLRSSTITNFPTLIIFKNTAAIGIFSNEVNGSTVVISESTGAGTITLSTGTSYTIKLDIANVFALKSLVITGTGYSNAKVSGTVISVDYYDFTAAGTYGLEILSALAGTKISKTTIDSDFTTGIVSGITTSANKLYVKHPAINSGNHVEYSLAINLVPNPKLQTIKPVEDLGGLSGVSYTSSEVSIDRATKTFNIDVAISTQDYPSQITIDIPTDGSHIVSGYSIDDDDNVKAKVQIDIDSRNGEGFFLLKKGSIIQHDEGVYKVKLVNINAEVLSITFEYDVDGHGSGTKNPDQIIDSDLSDAIVSVNIGSSPNSSVTSVIYTKSNRVWNIEGSTTVANVSSIKITSIKYTAGSTFSPAVGIVKKFDNSSPKKVLILITPEKGSDVSYNIVE